MSEQAIAESAPEVDPQEQIVTVKMNFGNRYHYRGFLYKRRDDYTHEEKRYRVPFWLWTELSQLKTKQGIPYFTITNDEVAPAPRPAMEYIPEAVSGHEETSPTEPEVRPNVAPQGHTAEPDRPGSPAAAAAAAKPQGATISKPVRQTVAKEIEGMDDGVSVG